MNAPRYLPSEEFPAAAWRAGMALALLCVFGAYARRAAPAAEPAPSPRAAEPSPAGREVVVFTAGPDAPESASHAPAARGLAQTAAAALSGLFGRGGATGGAPAGGANADELAAALSGRADPAALSPEAAKVAADAKTVGDFLGKLGIKPSGAPLTAASGGPGAVISEADKQAVLAEAASGRVGPVMQRLIAEGEKSGALDLPLYGGRSMRQIRDRAQELAAQADAQAEASRKAQYEAHGIDPASDTPDVVVPRLLKLLQGIDAEKEEAAAQFCEVRFARHPAAEAAIPYLEEMERSRKPEFEFAELALKRIRYFKAKRDSPLSR